ncbi:MAG TPA: lysine-sensitive aspartokinase 3 [Longimicrobium sp.]|nr:lysine-sensitive aspartokinase 3 [Longimicrobium sp.]
MSESGSAAGDGPLVMKFGGTSVKDAEAIRRLAGHVRARLDRRPVVVVSALSGVTDALVAMASDACDGIGEAALAPRVDALLARHAAEGASLLDGELRERLARTLEAARSGLSAVLGMMAAHPGTRRPLRDEVLSWGERLSSVLVTEALRAEGMKGCRIDARRAIRTDEHHGRAEPLAALTRESTRAEILPALAKDEVPVMGGFIGGTVQGATTTLGRGGSDFTAALVGAALDAAEIQIWTDVSGFMTADPRVVPSARSIPRLSYDEAAELAYFGARVLHPRTLHPAVERGVPVRVCNSMHVDAPSTLIDAAGGPSAAGGVKAIAHKGGVSIVRITSARMLGASGFLRAIFEVFDHHRIVVDVVATSEVSVSLTVDEPERIPEAVSELQALGRVEVEGGYAIVCAVGEGLRATPGVAGRVFGTLADVNVALISQGASGINLTFAVREEDASDTVRHLHAACVEPPAEKN